MWCALFTVRPATMALANIYLAPYIQITLDYTSSLFTPSRQNGKKREILRRSFIKIDETSLGHVGPSFVFAGDDVDRVIDPLLHYELIS